MTLYRPATAGLLCGLCTLFAVPVIAQTATDPETRVIYTNDEMVMSATRNMKPGFDVPRSVGVIKREDLSLKSQSRTMPEALKGTPGVMVQKTAHGQGSPFIRGFTGFRNLFLIDGIRLNNSIFREGPNEYWNTVDPFGLSKVEILMGPGSVLYGSDAIGGTVMATMAHRTMRGDQSAVDSRLLLRLSGAEQSGVLRAEVSGQSGATLGYLVGATLKDYGDLRAAGDRGVQKHTGYKEQDFDLRLDYHTGPTSRFSFGAQQVNQDDIWRTHKTIYGESWKNTSVGSELKRASDHKRRLLWLGYQKRSPDGLIRFMKTTLSHHHQWQEQHRIKSSGSQDRQGIRVDTTGLSLQLESEGAGGEWTYGFEYYQDDVTSWKKNYDVDGSFSSEAIQGPVGDKGTYGTLGIYAQDHLLLSDSLLLVAGLRWTKIDAEVDEYEDPVSANPASLEKSWSALVQSLHMTWTLDEDRHWNLYGGVAGGFRAPGLSDLTRFDSARSNEAEIPSPDLDPEHYLGSELGIKGNFRNFFTRLSLYHTAIEDMIVRVPTGATNADGEALVTKKNSATGYIQGAEAEFGYRFTPALTGRTSLTTQDGEVDGWPDSTTNKVREPVSRLMPDTVQAGMEWQEKGTFAGLELVHSAKQDNLSSRDKLDTQRIPPDGTPAYTLVHMRAGMEVLAGTRVALAVENLTDEEYRVHGSGQNEPGRNLIATIESRF